MTERAKDDWEPWFARFPVRSLYTEKIMFMKVVGRRFIRGEPIYCERELHGSVNDLIQF
jgi:hypothetical protein